MRRLTLILSDVYLPEQSDTADSPGVLRSDALPMPSLEWLLRFSAAREVSGDWRAWLLSTDIQNCPVTVMRTAS